MKFNFLSKKEKNISRKFNDDGYIILNMKDKKLLDEISKLFFQIIKKNLKIKIIRNQSKFFDNFHKYLKKNELNKIRLELMKEMNKSTKIKELYYECSKEILNVLVGNELAMQKRINLSIQLPNDQSSLLPLHSDIWSGDSPFEIVIWIPLVNCFKTKSMYILKAKKYKKFEKTFKKNLKGTNESLFKKIKNDLKWLKVKRGQILAFNQSLPHGNIINKEKETRWSLNCRFKSIFTPYGDKKIAEFFEPITLRKISEIGIDYNFPGIK